MQSVVVRALTHSAIKVQYMFMLSEINENLSDAISYGCINKHQHEASGRQRTLNVKFETMPRNADQKLISIYSRWRSKHTRNWN